MIQRHQGKLFKGFFTRSSSVYPDNNKTKQIIKKNDNSEKKQAKTIISPKKNNLK